MKINSHTTIQIIFLLICLAVSLPNLISKKIKQGAYFVFPEGVQDEILTILSDDIKDLYAFFNRSSPHKRCQWYRNNSYQTRICTKGADLTIYERLGGTPPDGVAVKNYLHKKATLINTFNWIETK